MVLNFKNFICENNFGNESNKTIMSDMEFSSFNKTITNSIILTTFNDFSNWARLSSLWPLLYGTSCCFIEFASLIGSRFDFDRYGLVPRSSPRQADLIITAGTVTMKMAPSLVRLYEQMPEPKYVIAMGACTITGGMFSTDSYSTVRGVDKLIPVDIYLPGCPPKPEAIIDAIIKLRKRIAQEIYEDKKKLKQGKRYLTLNHQFGLLININSEKSNQHFNNQILSFEETSKLSFKAEKKESEISKVWGEQ
uniref:NADH-plastoquinone oxidoreductase subunit K n=1 Tax=Pleurozia gigantea TaxID=255983 RepID=UPI00286B55FF|nr:NADH-plastoquinone oxidoreductase subunit K [Pleurozia gigantea]WKR35065.1 NADH-plastoquinone oxidoreductase subunit K [Pleurozia gigantea]WKR35151.1 NADH-plastoquinone oxidoreductase subunit K [Pleurozia subinflata]